MTASSRSFHDLIAHLRGGASLAPEEIDFAAGFLLAGEDAELKADFLRALSAKGETDEEIAGFVEAFLTHAVNPGIDPAQVPGPMLDVCGTGGDRLDLFNVSTTSMFILAAGGAVVVKHGNRSISSQCGGADVLEALGVQIDLSPEALKQKVETVGLGFLFASLYHPAFKVIAPVRKIVAAEGGTTIFSLLGPLLNPARPAHQLVGVFSEAALPKYAAVLRRLGRKRAWAIHGKSGDRGMDEISTLGPTRVLALEGEGGEGISECQITPEALAQLGIGPASLEELRGGSREENAQILLGILNGTLQGPKRDIALLNAAAGFVVAGLASDLAEGLARAKEQIASGRAMEKLNALRA